MPNIIVAAVGRLKQTAEKNQQERYLERIQKAGPAQGVTAIKISEITESKQATSEKRKQDEAQSLIKQLPKQNYLIALDENGTQFESKKFANLLKTQIESGSPNISFCLGGPDGHGKELLKQANMQLSLSKMTLPHGLARVIVLEQIYRAITIWSHHPYHRV